MKATVAVPLQVNKGKLSNYGPTLSTLSSRLVPKIPNVPSFHGPSISRTDHLHELLQCWSNPRNVLKQRRCDSVLVYDQSALRQPYHTYLYIYSELCPAPHF